MLHYFECEPLILCASQLKMRIVIFQGGNQLISLFCYSMEDLNGFLPYKWRIYQISPEIWKRKRGITKVPNIRYTTRNKFAFGAVMQVNGMNYYVSVSSFDKKQEANILIRVPGDEKKWRVHCDLIIWFQFLINALKN